jgi:hypothetical protein
MLINSPDAHLWEVWLDTRSGSSFNIQPNLSKYQAFRLYLAGWRGPGSVAGKLEITQNINDGSTFRWYYTGSTAGTLDSESQSGRNPQIDRDLILTTTEGLNYLELDAVAVQGSTNSFSGAMRARSQSGIWYGNVNCVMNSPLKLVSSTGFDTIQVIGLGLLR